MSTRGVRLSAFGRLGRSHAAVFAGIRPRRIFAGGAIVSCRPVILLLHVLHGCFIVWLNGLRDLTSSRPFDPQSVPDGPAQTVTCCPAFEPVQSRMSKSGGVAVRRRCHRGYGASSSRLSLFNSMLKRVTAPWSGVKTQPTLISGGLPIGFESQAESRSAPRAI